MTQPDKWKVTAERLALDAVSYERGHYDDSPGSCDVDIEAIATALRAAHAEGERAGMERAAVIAEAMECEWANDREEAIQGYPVGVLVSPSDAIRAAKETKE